ncbi:hypothetical protein Back11_15280 [Paenibacillus baekrokdamisoli]|uniref:Uncharacterized protein n=1 Tax=Paenibacillus baekrokdamisoli TaxID=1712516 RepID=A0A3G9J5V4_9BACL|nr:hypothetical protein [Paenibacillus baekrokdamisoli]MBB3072794.1 hypothetical protein [Paenibacillus baekrokdamisoli]BBH20183.1 hypothetical protein Back11_15280 [Paenibacillus baekrokdamisoli]
MTKKLRMVLAVCLLIGLLTACSSEPAAPINPEAIEVSLSTEPVPAVAGNLLELRAKFTGAEFSKSTQVTFDIRLDGKPKLIEGQNEGNGAFTGNFTFPQAGQYDVYLHLYVDDLHMTKKKQVDVK